MPRNARLAPDAEMLLLKTEHRADNDDRKPVPEKNFLKQGEVARQIDEQIHQREAQRRAQNKEDSKPLSACRIHTQYYMRPAAESQTRRRGQSQARRVFLRDFPLCLLRMKGDEKQVFYECGAAWYNHLEEKNQEAYHAATENIGRIFFLQRRNGKGGGGDRAGCGGTHNGESVRAN